ATVARRPRSARAPARATRIAPAPAGGRPRRTSRGPPTRRSPTRRAPWRRPSARGPPAGQAPRQAARASRRGTSAARSATDRARATEALVGTTNYHSRQPALRKLYAERYSRRMPFPEFQQREIEIVSDEQTVADWKEQARTSTTYTTTKEAKPITFKSAFDT